MSRGLRLPLILVGALLAGEYSVRLIRPERLWVSPETDDYSAAVWRARRIPSYGGARPVTIVGNSGAREGFDQEEASRSLSRPVANWALSAEPLDGLARMPLPPGRGGDLILALNANIFEGRSDRDPRYDWNRPRGASFLAFYRGEYAAAFHARLARLWDDDPVATGRATKQYRYRECLVGPALMPIILGIDEKLARTPEMTDEQAMAALRSLVADGRSAGYTVRAFWLPTRGSAPDFIKDTPRMKQARVVLRELGVPQIPAPSGLIESDYHDFHHVLSSGRAKLTRVLISALEGGA